MDNQKIIIIGGGQAGCQTATSLRASSFSGEISIYCSENYLPYQRPPLSKKFLLGELDKERLFFKPEKFYRDNNINFFLNSYVTKIETENKKIFVNNNKEDSYDKLVLATGTKPREIEADKDSTKNIFYLRSIDDVLKIKDKVKNSKKVAIIGGGYIGLEVAAILKKLELSVTIIEMAGRILERVTSQIISDFYTKIHNEEGVKILTNTSVERITKKSKDMEILTNNGSISADFIVVGIGVIPCDELASKSGLKVQNGILVNEFCETSVKDIYSAGDCTLHPNSYYNKDIRLESVHNAIEQGKTVASSIMDKKEPYNQIPWFWSDQYDLKLQIAGLCIDYDDIIVRGNSDNRSFALFYMKNNYMIASDCINRPGEHMMSRKIISDKIIVDQNRLSNDSIPIKEVIN
ncbi:MAG: FAD-dependent oxidoreductase [Pseudomonadota bacterium]|nr:FAD-dependent oxidoreductase [Pseudomonadota bacterium]MEC9459156.1 FAD-dependent oxidoreductase [Pseudomonadota bacterium]MEC9481407.1 FAD-dependent oxidoreductase [Pseudomonadota bacterium]